MHKLREHFPTAFAAGQSLTALRASLKALLASDLVVLLAAVVIYVAVIVVTWLVLMFAGTSEVLGIRVVPLLYMWTCSAIAVFGAWTSLGRGAWHWRFLAACWAALCMVAALVGVLESPWTGIRGEPERLTGLATFIFASAAFCAQWIASIGRVRIGRSRVAALPNPLRTGQYNIATLLLVTAIMAAILGAIRTIRGLLSAVRSLTFDLTDGETWAVVTWACFLVLAAIPAVLRSRRTLLLVVPSLFVALWIGGFWSHSMARSIPNSSYFQLLTFMLRFEVLAIFGAAVVQLLGLRLCGFRLERIEHGVDTGLA